jgi:hypothetical protein
MTSQNELSGWVERAKRFQNQAHKLLGIHEDSRSRVVTLGSSYHALGKLSIKQDDLFRQALTCIERECYRAAHVMAWAAFMDFVEEKIFEDGGAKLSQCRPKWPSSDPESLREEIVEYQIIAVLKELKLCSKSEVKALHGLLNKRNECAHPGDYYPDLNGSLGYISELFNRISTLQAKSL